MLWLVEIILLRPTMLFPLQMLASKQDIIPQ